MRTNDFASLLGDEYRLLTYAYPFHDEFQKTVADTIAEYFRGSDNIRNSGQEIISVVEAGAGSGITTSFILDSDPGTVVVAVDNASVMLDQAKQALADQTSRVTFVCDHVLNYLSQQPDSSFDAFTAVWTIHNLPPVYRAELFPHIYRVLKPGGVFVSGDKYTVDDLDLHSRQLEMQLERFREFGSRGNQQLADAWVRHNLDDEEIRIGEKEQKDILRQLHFTAIDVVYRRDMEAIIRAVK